MYSFDWNATNDAITDKSVALHRLIEKILDDDISSKKGVLIAHNAVISNFELLHPFFNQAPSLVHIHNDNIEMEYAGRIRNQMKKLYVDFFRDASFPLDKLVLFSVHGDKHRVVELKNVVPIFSRP